MRKILLLNVLLLGFVHAVVAQAAQVGLNWKFQPVGHSDTIPVRIGYALGAQLPREMPCCEGTYIATLDLRDARASVPGLFGGNGALLFPPIGGLTGIELNGKPIGISGLDYGNAGPIVPVSDELLRGETLELRVHINFPRTSYSGIWYGNIEAGELPALNRDRELWIVHQIFVPLVHAFLFTFIGVVLLWLRRKTRISDPVLKEFIRVLFLWAGFYMFLSGQVRAVFPAIGSALHLPTRCLAGLALVRLMGAMAGRSSANLRNLSVFSLILIAASVPFGFVMLDSVQIVVYVLMNLLFLYFVLNLARNLRSNLHWLLFVTGLIAATGYLFDSAKMVLNHLDIAYPFPYFNRYTTPPMLLMSIVYLADVLSREVFKSIRRDALEEIAAQVVHDLKSPLAALKAAFQMQSGMSEETRKLLQLGTQRIDEISSSLRLETNKSGPSEFCICALARDVLTEKRAELKGRPGIELKLVEASSPPYYAKIDRVEFQRMISNLLNNAIEAIDEKGEVELSVYREGRSIRMQVRDDGKGIPADVLSKIGQRGFTSGKVGGSGLGLYHAKKVIDLWGGQFKVESQGRQGTVVSISLPIFG